MDTTRTLGSTSSGYSSGNNYSPPVEEIISPPVGWATEDQRETKSAKELRYYSHYAMMIDDHSNGYVKTATISNSEHSVKSNFKKDIAPTTVDSCVDSQSRLSLNSTTRNSKCNSMEDITYTTVGVPGRKSVSSRTNTTSVSSISLCSDDSFESDFSTEHTRVSTLLDNIDPKRLCNYLKKKVKQKDRTAVSALSILLPKSKFNVETMHCVRCHKEFDPRHGEKECILFHRERDVKKIAENEIGADFGCERCGTIFQLDGRFEYKRKFNKKRFCGACFVGEHTFRREDVSYEPEGLAKTCEDRGCIVFYV